MYFDGSKMLAGSGAGVILIFLEGDKLRYVLHIHFAASNNVVEYEALLHGLRIVVSLGIRGLLCSGDSDLVVQQVMKDGDAKDPSMIVYREEVASSKKSSRAWNFIMFVRSRTKQLIHSRRFAPPESPFLLVFFWSYYINHPSKQRRRPSSNKNPFSQTLRPTSPSFQPGYNPTWIT